jgi:hypothetical protein
MVISNPLKGWTTLPMENDVLGVSREITISWQDDSNLFNSSIWILIATPVSVWVEAQGDATLLLQRHVSGQFKSLPVKVDSRMHGMQHVLKRGQDVSDEVLIEAIGHTITEGSRVIVDVELRIDRSLINCREEGASTMDELSMKLECVRTATIIDRVVKMSPNRCHRKGAVVSANVTTKRFCDRVLSSEKLHIVEGGFLEGRQRDLSLIATHAKLRSSLRGGREAFIHPMKGMTGWTVPVKLTEEVDRPRRVKWSACNRNQLEVNDMIEKLYKR